MSKDFTLVKRLYYHVGSKMQTMQQGDLQH